MPLNEATVHGKVDEVIDEHGTDIDVLKFATIVPDLYGQGPRTFAAAVSTRGRGIRSPTKDQITVIGDSEEVDIAFVFSRLELERKFPGLEPFWITNDDEIGFEGRRYRILSTRSTGKAFGKYSMLVAIGAASPGSAETPYP